MMERVAEILKIDGNYYMDYWVSEDDENVDDAFVGSFRADRITVELKTDDDDDTSGYITLHVGENKMEFTADKIEGMDNLNEGDVA